MKQSLNMEMAIVMARVLIVTNSEKNIIFPTVELVNFC